MSSPKIKNISLFQKCKSGYIACIPSRPEGRSRSSRTWDGDAVDAKAATDERGLSVRQRRVVLTSRCWRQCTWRQLPSGRHGGKRAVLRGDHVISRKAIAQGMSDVLRCPVCSCAHSFYPLHMRPRVQRASGIPCALFLKRAKSAQQPSGATRREKAELYPPSLRAQRSNLWRSKKKEWIASSLALLAMTVGFAEWQRRACAVPTIFPRGVSLLGTLCFAHPYEDDQLSALHEPRERLGIVRMPARQRRAVFDDVAGGPLHAAFVEFARRLVVGAEDVEIAGVDALNHEIDRLPGRPGARRLLGAAARGQTRKDMTGDQ